VSQIDYTVRRSERARRVRVTVDAARGVQVVLPRRAPEREAAAAVRELGPWIARRLAELERARSAVAARGEAVPYLGRLLTVRPEPGRVRVHRRGDELLAPAGAGRADARALVSPRRPRGDRAPAGARLRAGRQQLQPPVDPRTAHPLGELLAGRGDEL
jgi:predicted metal-dependent hydrolase